MSDFIDNFIQSVAAGDVERLSRDYWSTIDNIAQERSLEFIELFKRYSKRLDEKIERALITILSDLVDEKRSDYSELYEVVLDMMYNSHNCKPSVPYRYIYILQHIDTDWDKLFEQVVGHTSVNSIESVCISIYSLYTSLGVLGRFKSAKVRLFLDIVISCLNRSKSPKLAATIEDVLLPLIGYSEYKNYYNRFAIINREIK